MTIFGKVLPGRRSRLILDLGEPLEQAYDIAAEPNTWTSSPRRRVTRDVIPQLN